MVDVYINHMSGKIFNKFEPPFVAAAEELHNSPVDHVVLIVVVRNQWRLPTMANRFMVSIEIAKMAPAVLVDDFPPREKRLGS